MLSVFTIDSQVNKSVKELSLKRQITCGKTRNNNNNQRDRWLYGRQRQQQAGGSNIVLNSLSIPLKIKSETNKQNKTTKKQLEKTTPRPYDGYVNKWLYPNTTFTVCLEDLMDTGILTVFHAAFGVNPLRFLHTTKFANFKILIV